MMISHKQAYTSANKVRENLFYCTILWTLSYLFVFTQHYFFLYQFALTLKHSYILFSTQVSHLHMIFSLDI